ncbi:hypothetical protein [Ciceribacter sp. L1K22]|uniref:hypothetical protein n=1 Tax=Ciceribacter sp. L1K22 TaxID=2820275 RepID=UPI001ABEAC60|nr:hypothetical protein [Ciceribacter sp. L1K22]MBO3761708.1 hypothetical protein [Ciceribacter sp. L1K22]
MRGRGEGSVPLLRRVAFWLVAMVLLGGGLFALERMVEQRLDLRVTESVSSIADSYVGHAEASLDYGLSLTGPGSVEAFLQPPPSLASGKDALSLRLEALSLSADGHRPAANTIRSDVDALVVERAILDSHGEATSRLILSRSITGERDAAQWRRTALSVGLAIFGVALALFVGFLPLRRVALIAAAAFVSTSLLLLVAFGIQSTAISRQAAVLAVAETASDIDRAAQLGMRFDQLVGMQDFLARQLGTNSAINQLTVKGVDGLQFQAGTESFGSTVATLLSAPPLSRLVDLGVGQVLANGIRVDAVVSVHPILVDLGSLAVAVGVFWVCGGALLLGLADGRVSGAERSPLAAAVAPALLFLILFSPFADLGPSTFPQGLKIASLAVGLILGLLLRARLAMLAMGIAVVSILLGLWFEVALAYGGTGLLVGVAFISHGQSIRTLHLLVAMLPCVVLMGAEMLGSVTVGAPVAVAVLVLAVASIAISPQVGKLSAWRGQSRADWQLAGLPDLPWIWLCLGLMQTSLFLLVVLAARQERDWLAAGALSYVLCCFILHLVSYRLAGAINPGLKGRVALFEVCIFAAVMFVAAAYIGGWSVVVCTALAAALSGAAARLSVELPFLVRIGDGAKTMLTYVRLIALVTAMALGLFVETPEDFALPAVMACLVALAPLAYATLAGLDPAWTRRRSAERIHAS